MIIHLAVLDAYDKVGASAETLYFATKGFTSTPSDTPVNTFFDPRITSPAKISRTMFAPGRTFGASQVGFGDLVLSNEDGALDFLEDYAFDGRSITQYRGDEGSAFPGGYTKVLVATMEQAIPDRRSYRIKIRDRQDEVDIPLQPTKYAGNNALPAGLEGVADDLKGKPKPLLYGVVKNVSPPQVNTSKLIYQIHDGALDSVDEVYDSGIRLTKTAQKWTQQAATSTIGTINGVGYDPNADRWVVVGGTGDIEYSDDGGASWSVAGTPSFGADPIEDVLWCEELSLWVACGWSGKIATSTDGNTWTQRTNTFTDKVTALAFDGTTIVAVTSNNNEIETSTNGTTWTSRTAPTNSMIDVIFAPNRKLFVTVGGLGKVWTSPDGTTWTESNPTPITTLPEGIAFGRGLFVMSANAATQIAFSRDAVNWSIGPNIGDSVASLNDIFYSELLGKFVIGGSDGAYDHIMAFSEDGVSWEYADGGFGTSGPQAIWGSDSTVMAVGAGNKVATLEAGAAYSTEAQLLDDDNIPSPGTYKVYLAGGYIRLGSPPAGLITADATAGAAAADRTAGQIFTDILTQAGLTSADWTAGDITTLDSSIDDVIGYWSGTNEVLASTVLSLIAESIHGWWGTDAVGSFRIKELLSPGGESSTLTITKNDMVKHLQRVPPRDPGRGIPSYRSIVRYAKNYTVQDRDLAGGVTDVRRAELAREWAEVADTDATVQTAHLLAREHAYHTLLAVAADAVTAADRIQTLRGVKRSPYQFAVPHNSDFEAMEMGDIVTIEHDRFGLSAGVKMAVMELDPEPNEGLINLGVWG